MRHTHEAPIFTDDRSERLKARLVEMRKTLGTEIDLAEPKQPNSGDIGRGRVRRDNITPNSRGTDPTYALRRLKRDREDLAEKVISGELSANAAAIQAGFRKRTVSIPLEPRSIARTLRRHLTDDQLEDLIAELAGGAS